jgi:hypothetical protein
MTINRAKNRFSFSQRILYGSTNWLLFIAGIVNLVVGTWAAAQGDVAISATSLTAGLILLFASTIDRFESLKGLGVEAKTRKLDEKIEQADDMFKRLRELTELTGAALIANNARVGRWAGAPKPVESYTLAESLRAILEGLGADETAIKRILQPWVRITFIDLMNRILKPLHEAALAEQREIDNQRSALGSPISPTDSEYLRLNNRHRVLVEYISQLRGVTKFDLEDLPQKLLSLIEEIELADMQVTIAVKQKALDFAPSMMEFRTTYRLKDPSKWFAEINPIFEDD